MAISQDFDMYTGDTKIIQVAVVDELNNIVDLTGAIVKWILQQFSTSNSFIVEKDTTSGGIAITNPTSGIFQITLNPSDTQNLPQGTYFHQAKVIDVLNNSSTVLIGNAKLIKGSSLI